ncbi:MAG: hypothetical protein KF891_20265 [Rhizobacter sp.]|nr:hypothetical protein [Rhizobacter sp.]
MKAAFIGHYAPPSKAMEGASSAAGNQVQRQIGEDLSHLCGTDRTISYSMTPQPIWPRGPLVVASAFEETTRFIGYLNLPVLKHLVFAFRLFIHLRRTKPWFCLQYNSYLFENLALLIYRWSAKGSAIAMLIQDIHVQKGLRLWSKRGIKSAAERASLWLARKFDAIVPISSAIIRDFNFEPSKCTVFQGGVTRFASALMDEPASAALEDIAVFAGALEPHNGIDRLVDRWIADEVAYPLHVFGRGSLTEHVAQSARRCGRIVFHGFQSEDVVLNWQRRARWHFCLRYSVGLDEAYFFPSKLFNIVCSSGIVVVNDFHALPLSIRHHLCVVPEGLQNLAQHLEESRPLGSAAHVSQRREIVRVAHSWGSCVQHILQKVGGSGRA